MWFDAASNGMQFPPDMNKDGIKVYNERTIKIENYDYLKTD